tara:strand:- start:5456 stop:6406 length:951 start_codon:yes stop_codon:yes gene_type:complete
MKPEDKIYLAGHRGMVGSAILRNLKKHGFTNVIVRTREELDLCDGQAVDAFIEQEKPDCIINAAARVGGIYANSTYPAEFIHENLASAHNLVHSAWRHGVQRLLFLGSSCIYPRRAQQPMNEDALLSGPLEPTNEAYAIAKIAGLKLCQHYRTQYGVLYHSVMPTNLYGPHDNYHPDNSHVLPALIARFHQAKEEGWPEVVLWGTGRAQREFLHVDDLAEGVFMILQHPNPPDVVNVGFGKDITISELARMVQQAIGYEGKITFDSFKPDGTPRKALDISKIKTLGWEPTITLEAGIAQTYQDFLKEKEAGILRSH